MSSDPTAIRLDVAGNVLRITWADGVESVYPGAWLRFVCPCARCRGHAPGEVEPPTEEACRDVRVRHAETVGTYALRFTFSDGHETGIYSFAHLRDASPPTTT